MNNTLNSAIYGGIAGGAGKLAGEYLFPSRGEIFFGVGMRPGYGQGTTSLMTGLGISGG